jgi:hypothetical protein
VRLARLAIVTAAVAGCGRIGFDPAGGALPPNDGKLPHDGKTSDSGSASLIDAPVSACVANGMPVQAGVLTHVSTCASPDRLDGCGPTGTKEVILEFIPPASNGYNARAYDHGTMNITMVSTTVFDHDCQPMGMCAGLLGTTYTQGVPYYFVLEASSGGCADIDFLVD